MSAKAQAAGRPTEGQAAANRWPSPIKFIIGNEACERFSYYGIRSILALYISKVLFHGLPEGAARDRATEIIHLFIFANYFTPLLGAWLSDKLWGRYHTILYVSLVYCLGNLTLAFGVGSVWGLYTGLGLVALGSGGIKPCVSAFCGDQFRPEQSGLLQKAYGLFYWSINFGSFFSFLVIPWLKDDWGYRVAFGVPGLLMLVATLIFWVGRKQYTRCPAPGDPGWYKKVLFAAGVAALFYAGVWTRRQLVDHGLLQGRWAIAAGLAVFLLPLAVISAAGTRRLHRRLALTREKQAGGFMVVTWYALTRFFTRKTGQRFWDTAREKFVESSVDAAATVPPILSVFAPLCIFWALFDQTTSTWVMQGSKMTAVKVLGGFEIGAEQMQSMNPALVMILVPLMLWLYPRIEKLTGMRVSPLRRMGAGLVLGALAYVVVGLLQTRVDTGVKLSVLWQTLPYFMLTTGEVLLSTTGLEFAFTQAAAELKSTIMSFWLLTVAFGNLMVPLITRLKAWIIHTGDTGDSVSVNSSTFYLYAGLTLGVAIIFMLIALCYKERELELTSARKE
ncbi:MAG: MFS transporter [Limisphaerales bacterium]